MTQSKQDKNIEKHLDNLDKISKGVELTIEDYEYLDYCFICGKKISLFDYLFFNVSHGFDGNCHKWKCKGQEIK